jgi:CheY-like chemotaxis protein
MMQGEIGAQSKPGEGSTFWFTARLEKQATQAIKLFDHDLLTVHALVVDDNATNRQILCHQILGWKMHPASAASGPEALEILRKAAKAGKPYDLALLDVRMPEMDGITLARSIKADPTIAATRLVLLTSLAQALSAEELKVSDIDAYLVKPVKQSRLFDCIVTAMSKAVSPSTFAAADRNLSLADSPPHSPQSEKPSANCGMTAILRPLQELENIGKSGRLTGAEQLHADASLELSRIQDYLSSYRFKESAENRTT